MALSLGQGLRNARAHELTGFAELSSFLVPLDIEHARGNKAKAELWAKKALREDPEFAEAQEFLSQISG